MLGGMLQQVAADQAYEIVEVTTGFEQEHQDLADAPRANGTGRCLAEIISLPVDRDTIGRGG
jgi:hypothetical protein